MRTGWSRRTFWWWKIVECITGSWKGSVFKRYEIYSFLNWRISSLYNTDCSVQKISMTRKRVDSSGYRDWSTTSTAQILVHYKQADTNTWYLKLVELVSEAQEKFRENPGSRDEANQTKFEAIPVLPHLGQHLPLQHLHCVTTSERHGSGSARTYSVARRQPNAQKWRWKLKIVIVAMCNSW